jgi:LPXTG-motif cell wall-anchored protein
MSDTTTLILVGALAVLVLFYVMRRRARLSQDDD